MPETREPISSAQAHPDRNSESGSPGRPVPRTRFQRVMLRLGLWPRWHNPLSLKSSLTVAFLVFALVPMGVLGFWLDLTFQRLATALAPATALVDGAAGQVPGGVEGAQNRVWLFIGLLAWMAVCLAVASWLAARWAGPIDSLPQHLDTLDSVEATDPGSGVGRLVPDRVRAVQESLRSLHRRIRRNQVEVSATRYQMDQTASDLVRVRQSVEIQVLERTQELTEKLRRAEKSERAKGTFMAQLSHEIRTPLQGVMGMLHLLEQSPLTAEQRDWLETLRSSSTTLLNVLDDSLDYSKIEAGKMRLVTEEFPLREAFQRVAKLFTPRATEKGLALEFQFDPHLPERVKGDADRLSQVVTNLVSNALKFTQSGTVRLGIRLTSRDVALVGIRIEVDDTGVGMDSDTQARLFQAYFQAEGAGPRRSPGGTGLGLAITRQLIQLMGGQIGVRSRPGQGTQVAVDLVLPIVDPKSGTPGGAVPQPPRSFRPLRVLVVDDDPTSQKFIRILLERAGHEVKTQDAAESMLSDWILGSRFDVVLLDLQLPQMSGLELATRLRELEAASVVTAASARSGTARSGTRTHLIALTASALEEDRRQALQAGFDQFLTKPVRVAELERALERVGSTS